MNLDNIKKIINIYTGETIPPEVLEHNLDLFNIKYKANLFTSDKFAETSAGLFILINYTRAKEAKANPTGQRISSKSVGGISVSYDNSQTGHNLNYWKELFDEIINFQYTGTKRNLRQVYNY